MTPMRQENIAMPEAAPVSPSLLPAPLSPPPDQANGTGPPRLARHPGVADSGRGTAVSLAARAAARGFSVRSAGSWPESPDDGAAPPVAGFVHSSFSPTVAAAARRCLERLARHDPERVPEPNTAVIIVSGLGDADAAAHVASCVDAGARIGPLLFFQCVPNAVAGHVAARWGLTGPVVSVGGEQDALDIARLLFEDGDATEALVIRVEPVAGIDGRGPLHAGAVLLEAGPRHDQKGTA